MSWGGADYIRVRAAAVIVSKKNRTEGGVAVLREAVVGEQRNYTAEKKDVTKSDER